MKNLLASVAVALVVLSAAAVQAAQQKVTLKIDNMHCPACPLMIERQLERLDGVSKVDVSWGDGTATVVYESTKVTPDRLNAELSRAGYSGRVHAGPE